MYSRIAETSFPSNLDACIWVDFGRRQNSRERVGQYQTGNSGHFNAFVTREVNTSILAMVYYLVAVYA